MVKKGVDLSLDNLITNANAQTEWNDCWWCPNSSGTPYGDVQVPYSELCGAGYTYVYDYTLRRYVQVPVGGQLQSGYDCEAAQTMGSLFCEWTPPCS